MIQHLLRNYVEISYLIINRKVSVDAFMRQFQLSNYEYKTDLEKMADLADDYGMKLIINDKTIAYEVYDQEAYRFSEFALSSFFYTHRYIFSDKTILLQWYLCKKFLWQNKEINIDDISEELGYSRSNLRDVIKASRSYMSNYGINIVNRPHYGLNVEGNEYDIRRCLVSIYSYMDMRVVKSDDSDIIYNSFSEVPYSRVNRAIADIFSSFGYEITSANRRMIHLYLIVQNARIKNGFITTGEVNIDNDLYREIVRYSPLRRLALTLLNYMSSNMGFGPYNELETHTLMAMLVNTGPFEEFVSSTVEKLYLQEKKEVSELVIGYLEKTYHMNLSDYIRSYMDKIINTIIISHHMKTLSFDGYRLKGRPGKVHEYPMLRKINSDLTVILSDYYGYYIAESQIEAVCELMYYCIKLKDVSYPKLRIGVGCRGSLDEQDLLATTIRKEINSSYYEVVESCNYLDIIDNQDTLKLGYDLVVCDQKMAYDEGILSLQTIGYNFSRLEYYIRYSRNLVHELEKSHHEIVNRFIDFDDIEKLRGTVEDISEATGVDQETVKLSLLNSYDEGEIRTVFIPADNDIFYLSLGQASGQKNGRKKGTGKIEKYVLLVSRVSDNNIQIINSLLHELVYNSVFFDNLASDLTFETINNQMNTVFK